MCVTCNPWGIVVVNEEFNLTLLYFHVGFYCIQFFLSVYLSFFKLVLLTS